MFYSNLLSFAPFQEVEPNCGEALCRLFPPDDNIDIRSIALKAKKNYRKMEGHHRVRPGVPSSGGHGNGFEPQHARLASDGLCRAEWIKGTGFSVGGGTRLFYPHG